MSIVCQLCGNEYLLITASHLRLWHNISLRDYYQKFPGEETISRDYRNLVSDHRSGISTGPLSEERRKEISKFQTKLWTDPDYRKDMLRKLERSTSIRGPLVSKALTGRTLSIEACRAISMGKLGFHHSQETKDRISRTKKAQFQDPEYAREMTQRGGEGPNNDEIWLGIYLDKYFPGEWKYVGDKKVWIGGKNPDFINIDGRKAVIEIFGAYWHEEEEVRKRITHFKEFGYACLVLWDDEIREELVVKKVKSFQEVCSADSV